MSGVNSPYPLVLMSRLVWARILVAGVAAVAAAACGNTSAAGPGSGGGRGRGRGGDSGPAPVVTAKVSEKDVPVDLAAIGNVEAYATISVRSQVTGQLQEISFREGDVVRKGEQLFALDRRPFEAALAQADANFTRDKALLAQAEAQLARDASNAEYQQLTAERQAQLVQRGIISRDAGEQVRAQADATAAVVKADRANIESARAQLVAQQAAVDSARVSLDYTIIKSPIDGRTGNMLVKEGNVVKANDVPLVNINQIHPIYVSFSVPEKDFAEINKRMTERLPVKAVINGDESHPAQGKLSFADNYSLDAARVKFAVRTVYSP